MASSNTDLVEEIITCVICLKYFNDPRILPCSHTYCLQCIKEVAAASNGSFQCPLRDGINIANNHIDSLPLNRVARDIIELHGT
jgi:tripartite motif-containing protein 59